MTSSSREAEMGREGLADLKNHLVHLGMFTCSTLFPKASISSSLERHHFWQEAKSKSKPSAESGFLSIASSFSLTCTVYTIGLFGSCCLLCSPFKRSQLRSKGSRREFIPPASFGKKYNYGKSVTIVISHYVLLGSTCFY